MKIEISHIAKTFGPRKVLQDVSLTLQNPGIYVMVGANGAGKTTLLRILALLETPDAGNLRIDDHEVYPPTRTALLHWRRRMVMVHNPAVMLSGTVAYNLGYGLRLRGQDKTQSKNRVQQMLAKISLNGREKQSAQSLSAGETQRLAVARGLVLDPEVIFLDEPTANLDPLSVKMIENCMREAAGAGKILVMSSHNLWQVERLASRVWFLHDGRIHVAEALPQGDSSLWSDFWLEEQSKETKGTTHDIFPGSP